VPGYAPGDQPFAGVRGGSDSIGGVSPVSRRRKKKQKSTRRPGGRSPSQRSALREIYAEVTAALRSELDAVDPLETELMISGLLGTWRRALGPAEDPESSIGADLVAYAATKSTRGALALLRGMAAVAASEDLRGAASTAADTVAAGGVAEPAWSDVVGRPGVEECWRAEDVYGDGATLVCGFAYGGQRHAIVAMMDFNHLGGWVRELLVSDDPDGVKETLRTEADAQPLIATMQVDPAEAGPQLRAALAATDLTWKPETGEDYDEYVAIARARSRLLPGEDVTPDPAEVDEPARQKIVEDFLGSTYAPEAVPGDVARRCARLIVDYGADHDAGRPLRVGPAKLGAFLLGWLPNTVAMDEDERRAMAAMIVGWVRWAGERTQLADHALTSLVDVATEMSNGFEQAWQELESESPVKNFLTGLDVTGGADVQDALERRRFAMPYTSTTIGGETHDDLDPSDPDERSLLIRGEHPEYHDALADTSSDETVDGVDPRLHITLHEVIASQLWDDNPPQVWQAAKRSLEAGHDRHEILHGLMHELGNHLFQVMSADQGVGQKPDIGAYVRSLDALGREAANGDGGRAERIKKARAARRANAAKDL
jgi:hypothetical protein